MIGCVNTACPLLELLWRRLCGWCCLVTFSASTICPVIARAREERMIAQPPKKRIGKLVMKGSSSCIRDLPWFALMYEIY